MTGTREIGVGLISVGWMGKLHTRAYQAMPSVYPELGLKCRLVIAADTAPDRVEYAKDVLGYERGTTDYREVLADPDVDVVSICAPNMLHREIGIAAAKAGKPFWIEKPVGRDARETAEVAAAAREAGVATSIGYNYRHAPAIERMRELIADGTLGRITNIRSVFLNGYAAEPKGALSWRFQKEFSGSGAMGDLLSHVADLVQYVVGPIDEVTALSTIIHAERPILPMGSGTHFAVIEDGEMGTVENEDYGAVLARFAPNSRGAGRGRHPRVLPRRRRAAVRPGHRGVRHRGLGDLELRADERAQARRGPRRCERRATPPSWATPAWATTPSSSPAPATAWATTTSRSSRLESSCSRSPRVPRVPAPSTTRSPRPRSSRRGRPSAETGPWVQGAIGPGRHLRRRAGHVPEQAADGLPGQPSVRVVVGLGKVDPALVTGVLGRRHRLRRRPRRTTILPSRRARSSGRTR